MLVLSEMSLMKEDVVEERELKEGSKVAMSTWSPLQLGILKLASFRK